jgi:hypothetical protein
MHTIPHTVLPPITLEGGYDKVRTPRSRGFGLIRPTSTQPRPSLDAHHRLTGRKGQHDTGLRVISPSRPRRHHGVQGWPTIPRARRYSHLYRNRQNFTSRHPGVPASSYPIKGQARALQKRGRTQLRDQHLQQSPVVLFFLSLRLGLGALSRQLVTPTQAPRCKEIQNSLPPAGRRAFCARTRINPRVFSLHHHPG